ncbi:MAG: hypothetical protein ACFCVC_10880 [Acidimicrobiia bacterium]
MFLLARPPVMRWAAAAALVVAAMWLDLRPPAVTDHPFLLIDVGTDQTIEDSMVEMRPVLVGTFDPVQLPVTALRPMVTGDPVIAGAMPAPSPSVPEGWLVVELSVPAGTSAGADVVVVVSDTDAEPILVSGVVVEAGAVDDFGEAVAACAFPPREAALVAVAISEQRASVLVGG